MMGADVSVENQWPRTNLVRDGPRPEREIEMAWEGHPDAKLAVPLQDYDSRFPDLGRT